MLVFDVIDLDDFSSTLTTERVEDDWWWYLTYVVLVVAGILAQLRFLDRLSASVRDQWDQPAPG